MRMWLRAPIDVVDAAMVVKLAVTEATSRAANQADKQVMPELLLGSWVSPLHAGTPLASMSALIAASTSARVCT